MKLSNKFLAVTAASALLSLGTLTKSFAQTTPASNDASKAIYAKNEGKPSTVFTANSTSITKDTWTAKRETLKTYDYRGRDYQEAQDFVILKCGNTPVVVQIEGKNTMSLIKSTKKLMQDMDAKGYENMVLMATDRAPTTKGDADNIILYWNNNYYGMLSKLPPPPNMKEEIWVFYQKDQKLLIMGIGDDPSPYIMKKIKEAYQHAGANIAMNTAPTPSQ